MPFKILHRPSSITAQIQNHNPKIPIPLARPSFPFTYQSLSCPAIRLRSSFSTSSIDVPSRVSRRFVVTGDGREIESEIAVEVQENEQLLGSSNREELGSQGLWRQMKEIVTFTGPAIGLWICGPLMSLIDTAVIGQGSAVELAALGIFVKFLLFLLPFDSCEE